jgi:ABC-type molybdate transport system ATPase subunit
VAHLSFEVRVELALEDGREIWVQLTRAHSEELELEAGHIVWVRPMAGRLAAAV